MKKYQELSGDEFSLILDKLEPHTEYIYYHLMGEPLIHPALPEFIKMAGDRGYKSVITTNGTLLCKRGEELLSAGLHKVNISLHSFEDGSGREYAKYIGELCDFAKRAVECGVIVVFRLWNKGHDCERNDTAIKLLRENIDGEWAENTRGIRIKNKLHLEWGDRFEWPDECAEIKGEKFFCYGLRDQFGILADGTVVPCCLDSEGVIKLGNIFREDIESILGSKRAENIVCGFNRGEASEDLCKRCGYARRFV